MECGQCNLCCKLTDLRCFNSQSGEWCKHATPGCGCAIYADRPDDCRNYNCSWKLDNNAHPSMRPDRCHVVFENINENIVFGTLDPNYRASKLVNNQIKAFVSNGSSVVLQAFEGKPRMYVARGTTSEQVWKVMKEKISEYQDDSTKLHNNIINA